MQISLSNSLELLKAINVLRSAKFSESLYFKHSLEYSP